MQNKSPEGSGWRKNVWKTKYVCSEKQKMNTTTVYSFSSDVEKYMCWIFLRTAFYETVDHTLYDKSFFSKTQTAANTILRFWAVQHLFCQYKSWILPK